MMELINQRSFGLAEPLFDPLKDNLGFSTRGVCYQGKVMQNPMLTKFFQPRTNELASIVDDQYPKDVKAASDSHPHESITFDSMMQANGLASTHFM